MVSGKPDHNQGVRKFAQFDLRIRRSGVRITLGAPINSMG